MTPQTQASHPGQNGEVRKVRVQRYGLVDEREAFRLDEKPRYVVGWTVDGGGYCFTPPGELSWVANENDIEAMATTPSSPSCADDREGSEKRLWVRHMVFCVVYDVVEDLLGESWRHDVGGVWNWKNLAATLYSRVPY